MSANAGLQLYPCGPGFFAVDFEALLLMRALADMPDRRLSDPDMCVPCAKLP
jgi:hypothetical protein